MARILVSSTGGAGHFNPLVPFIGGALAGGHDVVVAGPESLAARALRTGAEFRPLASPPREAVDAVMAGLPALSDDEANQIVCREIFGRLDTRAALPGLTSLLEEWRPDLVLRESAEFAAALAAEQHGVAVVRVAIGLGIAEQAIQVYAAPSVDEVRTELGLAADPDGRATIRNPAVSLFPASLEDPATPWNGTVDRFRDPGWLIGGPTRTEGRPFVYLTFGSVAGSLPHLRAAYGAALAAMDGLDADVLFTTGHGVDPDDLPLAPANVRVEPWVDQGEVLSAATAVVCHGGGGSTLGALAAGVPVVGVPLFALDQYVNVRRVVEVGAGLGATPDASSIRSALDEVLAGGGYAARAAELAAELAAQPSADSAPNRLLERFAC